MFSLLWLNEKAGFLPDFILFPFVSCPWKVQCYCPEFCCRRSELGTSAQPATTAPQHLSPALVSSVGWHCLRTVQHPDPSPTPRYLFSIITAREGWRAHNLRRTACREVLLKTCWSSPSTSTSWVAVEEQEVALCRVRTVMLADSKEMQTARWPAPGAKNTRRKVCMHILSYQIHTQSR